MPDHDLAAELAGYRAELEHCEKYGKDERGAAVHKEVSRVQDEVRAEAERLEADATNYDQAGQGVRAAVVRNEAREYRALLDDDEPAPPVKRGPGRPRKETAEDKTPKERA